MAAHHIIPDWPRVFSGCCRRVSLDRTLGTGISQGLTFWLVPNNSFKREAASRLPLIQALELMPIILANWKKILGWAVLIFVVFQFVGIVFLITLPGRMIGHIACQL